MGKPKKAMMDNPSYLTMSPKMYEMYKEMLTPPVDFKQEYECGWDTGSEVKVKSTTPEFKVGDEVEVVGDTYCSIIEKGARVRIIEDKDCDGEYEIERLEGDDCSDYAKPESLRKIEPGTTFKHVWFDELATWGDKSIAEIMKKYNYNWVKTPEKEEKTMVHVHELTEEQKTHLDEDTKALLEAGVITPRLELDREEFVVNFLFKKYRTELAEEARKQVAEAKMKKALEDKE